MKLNKLNNKVTKIGILMFKKVELMKLLVYNT